MYVIIVRNQHLIRSNFITEIRQIEYSRFLQKIRQLVLLFCLIAFILPFNCFAITSTIDNNYNFGTFTQTASTASFVLSYDGIMSSVNSLSASGSPTVGKVTFTTEKNGDNLTFTSVSSTVELNGCTLSFSNITPSATDIVLNPGQGKVRTITFGVSVAINGFCEKGTYNVSGVQIEASGSKTGNLTTLVPITVTFEEYIDVKQSQEMNFGSIWQPSNNGTVTIAPSGSYSYSGVQIYSTANASQGIFTVNGLTNREVQLSFTDAILYSGTNSMSVTNINSDKGNNFIIDSDNFSINVGGTLNISTNQPPGKYSGNYTLTLTY